MIDSGLIERLARAIQDADAITIGAGAGLSTSAGFVYSGERFERIFGDFEAKYGFHDMYTGGFYRFPTPEEKWAFWSRNIYWNRYVPAPKPTYNTLLDIVRNHDYFVITTNVDHQFQKAGFDKRRLFYTQGDYGLLQCSVPCHERTYDNEELVYEMLKRQENMRVPSDLLPTCPVCGKPMAMNLRGDDTFVEDNGWHEAARRYRQFTEAHREGNVLYFELGVGYNTPSIIKYPFWQRVDKNPQATYASINMGQAVAPEEIENRSILIDGDIDEALNALRDVLAR